MSNFLAIFLGILIMFPFVVTICTVLIYKRLGTSGAVAIGKAADWTTPFLFIAVYSISRFIFNANTGSILAFIAIIIMLSAAVHERAKVKEFQISKLLRRVWRFYFLLLAIAYILLLIIGLIKTIIEYNG